MTCYGQQFLAGRVDFALQLQREQKIGKLALPVSHPLAVAVLPLQIVETNLAHAMRAAGDVDHSRAVGGDQSIEQQAGQGEVPEVIGAELHLETVSSLTIRNRHDPGVVAQHVQRLMLQMKRVGKTAH
jgi:hypothetical protein